MIEPTGSKPNYFEEPFRIFFPVGVLLGLAGVSLWPVYYFGWTPVYPSIAHARLMIEGLMASFIIGFLGTAGPRITSTSPFSRFEFLLLLTLDLLAAGLHFGGAHRAGDFLFAFCLLTFFFVIGKRFLHRNDSPPPNFALVGLGLLNGIVGALLAALSEDKLYALSYRVGVAFLEQGFVLFPILGVASFLLPRLAGLAQPEAPESRELPPGWIEQAIFAAIIGLTIDATFVLEAMPPSAFAGWLRLGAIALYLVVRTPLEGRSFLAGYLRTAIGFIVGGFVMALLWPRYLVGALHVIFITGFGLVVLTVGIRVVFGHSGNAHLFQKRLPFFHVVAALMFVAMISRYVAEMAPAARTVHLVWAAIVWLIAVVIWAIKVLPKVASPDV